MGKTTVRIDDFLREKGREVKNKRGETMGFGLTRSQLVNGLGAEKRDLERAVKEGVIETCYVQLTKYSMETFYFARPKADAQRTEEAAASEPVSESAGLPPGTADSMAAAAEI